MLQTSDNNWLKLGVIIEPNEEISWCLSHTGSPYVKKQGNKRYIYFTGRDINNISRIGRGELILSDKPFVKNITKEPIVDLGDLGTFYEDGTSYPCVVEDKLYFIGWKKLVNVPFENNLGMALIQNNKTSVFSTIPIFELTENEKFGVGSVDILKDSEYHCWYTAFLSWGTTLNKKHTYTIKYAKSNDGVNWERFDNVCINFNDGEYAICRPSVVKFENCYHMVFCARGDKYKLGYAFSYDKVKWYRDDSKLNIKCSPRSFDSEEMCYPHWFIEETTLYLLYCGNNYGDSGVGIAKLNL
jgi:hypothetical protein